MKKMRNAITELKEEGHTLGEIAFRCGISVEKVRAYLKAAKAGYNTPHEQAEAEELKKLRKAGL